MDSQTDFFHYFSNFILSESMNLEQFNNLGPDQAVIKPLLPSMIKNLCHFMVDPHFNIEQKSQTFYFEHFNSAQSAQLINPSLKVVKCFPHEVFQFIESTDNQIILDCHELGATLVSRQAIPLKTLSGTTSLTLEPFMNYAFSNDLWNLQGKWPRFHDRLVSLFNCKSLLIDSHGPGHYKLDCRALKLKKFGISGLESDDSFSLILSWAYPLAALSNLEKIVSQEF